MINSIKEAFAPIVPIAVLVVILHWMTGFMQPGYMAYWLIGAFMAGAGLLFFLRGVDICLIPMGELIGTRLLFMPNMMVLAIVVFCVGFLACMADPCVTVLQQQVEGLSGNSGPPAWTIMAIVMSGIGMLLLLTILRIVWNIHPAKMFAVIVFLAMVLAVISTLAGVEDFVPLALDSGGVATGPLTVPFFLAIGLGFVSNMAGRSATSDGFGLLGIVVWGPILGVLLLGLAWGSGETVEKQNDTATVIVLEDGTNGDSAAEVSGIITGDAEILAPPSFAKTVRDFAGLGETTVGVLKGLVPLLLIGWVVGVLPSRVSWEYKTKLLKGAFWALLGLIVFLQAVNVGFAPVAEQLGTTLAGIWRGWALVPAGLVLGLSVGLAEPSVHVLCKQVEDVTDGVIPGRLLLILMASGVALAGAVGMTKLVLGLSILWIVIPGYIVIVILSCFCSKMFASIAYDASTVVTGPVLVAFLMILAANAAEPLGRDPLIDGFGFVATVAMLPILVVMAMGAVVEIRNKATERKTKQEPPT